MPNLIDQNGCTIATVDEIIAFLILGDTDNPGLFSIYGTDINVDPNSPDGQQINIFAQAVEDYLEFLLQIYNSFDPDKALGVGLDARCAINGVVRNAGTRTIQPIAVTFSAANTIAGVSSSPGSPFTVSDGSGNQYQLINDYAAGAAGTFTLDFQSTQIGAVTSAINTITTMVTIIRFVTGVNNPGAASSVGIPEETDYALRIRRQNSVSLPSRGYVDGLYAALIDTKDVLFVKVYENITNSTDADGIPAHAIWVIVDGGANADIAQDIYVERPAAIGMKGTVTVPVQRADGSFITIKFDRPTPEPLWIKFDVVPIGSGSVDPSFIRNQLLAQLSYGINQPADTTTIVSLIRVISPAASVSDEGVSDDGTTYVSLLTPSTIDRQWSLSAAHIIINGTPG